MAKKDIGVDLDFNGNALLNKGIETISSSSVLTPPAINGTVNDYAPTGIENAAVLRVNVVLQATLTGIQAPTSNQLLIIQNFTGSPTLILSNENNLSAAANRFSLGTSITLSDRSCAILYYDFIQSRWVCIGRSTSTASNVAVSGQVRFNGIISGTINANTDNWNPTGLATCNTIRVNVTANYNLTGIVAQPEGTVIILTNTNVGNTLTLVNNSLSSAGANRFLMGGNIILPPNQSCMIQYDGLNQRWRVISQT